MNEPKFPTRPEDMRNLLAQMTKDEALYIKAIKQLEDELDQLYERIRNPKIKTKNLVWTQKVQYGKGLIWEAICSVARYKVIHVNTTDEHFLLYKNESKIMLSRHSTLQEAQNSAQNDLENTIRASIAGLEKMEVLSTKDNLVAG